MFHIPTLSFFSGGGFLDIGFEKSQFHVIWSNEFKETFADMYEAGIQSWYNSLDSDIERIPSKVNRDSIAQLNAEQIKREAFGDKFPDVFCVIGGPPCQDFTHSGRNKGENGDRGKFTQNYIDMICRLRPTFFVMENVPGLHKKKHRVYFKKIMQQLRNAGYLTDARIISALELGVPQDRDRLFVIGFLSNSLPQKFLDRVMLDQQFGWFPWPEPDYPDVKELDWPDTDPFGRNNVTMPEDLPLELMVYRLLEGAEDLPNGQDIFVPYSDKFNWIKEGDVSGKSFKRLHRYRYSPTVWYGNNEVHLHPTKPRRLSVREALRIQTVPDEYIIPSENTLTDKFKIISNGVPSKMAHRIADSVYIFANSRNLLPGAESISTL